MTYSLFLYSILIFIVCNYLCLSLIPSPMMRSYYQLFPDKHLPYTLSLNFHRSSSNSFSSDKISLFFRLFQTSGFTRPFFTLRSFCLNDLVFSSPPVIIFYFKLFKPRLYQLKCTITLILLPRVDKLVYSKTRKDTSTQ